jgi:hypothetical protein
VRHYEFLFGKRKEAYDESLVLAKLADRDRAAATFLALIAATAPGLNGLDPKSVGGSGG